MNNHKDAGRGIAHIDYDRLNNPVRIQFTDGSVTRYVYSTTCIKGTGKLIRYQGREISQEILCHD